MMKTLLLRLSAPLQSWGDSSRYVNRRTRTQPTKSGVIGLLAAAQGRPRHATIDDLAGLSFSVRTDQLGPIERDFHTAIRPPTLSAIAERKGTTTFTIRKSDNRSKPMPLTRRDYLTDSTFVAALTGDPTLITTLHHAVANPTYPLFLGRRSCPPATPIAITITDDDPITALTHLALQSPPAHRRNAPPTLTVPLTTDAIAAGTSDRQRDQPQSFDPHHRRHTWRSTQRTTITITNPDSTTSPDHVTDSDHDPIATLDEESQ